MIQVIMSPPIIIPKIPMLRNVVLQPNLLMAKIEKLLSPEPTKRPAFWMEKAVVLNFFGNTSDKSVRPTGLLML